MCESSVMRGSNVVAMSKSVVSDLVKILRSGGVIAIPTDTIYGLASLAQSSEGVRKLYTIKGRDFNKPVSICVECVSQINTWAKVTVDYTLLNELLPGAVTTIFPRQPVLNDCLNPGVSTVGVRVIDHWLINELLSELKEPLALTSANTSGEQSSLNVAEFSHLHELLDCVVDDGEIPVGEGSRAGSTVVDLSVVGKYRIVRVGSAQKATEASLSHAGLLSL